MSNLKKKVIHSFKWKKNDEYCASKIGVSEEEYKKLKKQILDDRKKERKLNKLTQTKQGEKMKIKCKFYMAEFKHKKTKKALIKFGMTKHMDALKRFSVQE